MIKSNHPAFRPIDVKMGPDGAIYIADWYNPIIQHGEVDFRDPRRDHVHGRIWRVTAKGRPLVKKPDLVGAKTAGAAGPPEGARGLDAAARQARAEGARREGGRSRPSKRGSKGLDPKDADYEHHLLEALWTYQSLDVVEPELARHAAEREGLPGPGRGRARAVALAPADPERHRPAGRAGDGRLAAGAAWKPSGPWPRPAARRPSPRRSRRWTSRSTGRSTTPCG